MGSKEGSAAVRGGEADADGPFVSVVVPVYNDPDGLRETVESLRAQTYSADAHEILIVDNDSTDETRAVAREFASSIENLEVLVEDDVQSSYAARNAGIRNATGSVLAFVDADMTVPENWLTEAVRAMEAKGADYLGCNVEMIASSDGETLPDRYNLETGFPIRYFVEELGFAPTCCLLVRRSVIDDVGPFDPRLISSGDREFGHRVRESGRELHFAEGVTMYHPTRDTVGAQLKKERRIGRGLVQLRTHYPDRYGSRLWGAVHPWPFLPPRPAHLRRSIDGWGSRSALERAGFYALAYARSVSNGAGRLEELITQFVRGCAASEPPAPDAELVGARDRLD